MPTPARRRRRAKVPYTRLLAEPLEPRLALAAVPQLLTDLNPGAAASFPSDPVVIGDFAYFAADNGTSGVELWKTNGTPGGTSLVKDIRPGPSGSNPQFLTNVNGTLYFRASDGLSGDELWKSDGTPDGTVLVRDIGSGEGQGSYPANFVNAGGTLYFTADSKTTAQATAYGPTPYLSQADSPFDFAQLGTDFWLENFEDGQLNTPGVSASFGAPRNPSSLTDSVDADDGTIDGDGHLGHSYLVRPGITGVTFTFDASTLGGLPSRVGLVSTGSDFGLTVEFLDSAGNLIASQVDGLSKPDSGATSDDRFLGVEYAGGIRALRVFNPGTGNSAFEIDHLQYGAIVQQEATLELWKTDGTPTGTTLVTNLGNVPAFSAAYVNGTLFFTASEPATGVELWKTTLSGVALVMDINPQAPSSSPRALTNVNGVLYFSADDGIHGGELWKSDGSGTSLVKDISPGSAASSIASLTNLNGLLVFSAIEPASGNELWRSDGTADGTFLLKDIRPGVSGSAPNLFTVVNGALILGANDGVHNFKLWRTDGTSAGTTFLSDVVPGSGGVGLNSFASVRGSLFFSAIAEGLGFEAWQSDGISPAANRLSDLNPAAASSVPYGFVAVGNRVLFSADDGVHGRELFTLDINDAPSFTMQGDSFVVSDETPPVFRPANISFDGLSGHVGDEDLFTGYSESGFDVTPLTGRWKIMTTVSPTPGVLGNPPPSIWEDTFTASLDVTRSGGGLFRFDGIDFTRGTNYTLTGLRGDQTVFTQTGAVSAGPDGFVTVKSTSLATIDRLRIALVRSSLATTNLDNIRLAAVVPSLTLPDWLADRSPGPADEASQKLTLTVTNDNNGLFVDQPAIDYLGTLTFTPAPNAAGTALVTVTLADDGGTAAGGVDRVSKTFTITITKPHPWHNVANGLDVTRDGFIAPNDALSVINFLNAFGAQPVPADAPSGPIYYDASGDNFVAAADSLAIINAINAGISTPASASGAATFVGVDTTTQGNWSSLYGSDGYAIDAERTFLPDYAALAFTGGLTGLHDRLTTTTSTDPRALLKPDNSGRILSAWTGDYGFTLDINLTDGHTHQLALYVLDANTTSRNMRLDVLDATAGSVLDTQTVASFNTGKYLVWNLSGHIQIRFTNLANGLNTVLSGIFLGGPPPN